MEHPELAAKLIMGDYKIRILTEADPSALKNTQQATDSLTKSTKDLNTEMAKATQKYRDGQAPALANASAVGKMGDAAQETAEKKSKLVEAMKKAQGAIPGLSFAIGSFTNIWTVLAAAVVGVTSKIVEWDAVVKDNEARLKGFRDLNKEVERFSENIQAAKLDVEEFNRTVDDNKNKEETPAEEAERSTAATKRRFGSAKARNAAEKSLALDKIARREASGELSPEAADRERITIGASFDKRTQELDLTEKAEVAYIANRSAKAEAGRVAQLRGRLPGATDAALAAKNKRDDAKRALDEAMKFAGLDENLKAVPGGRYSQLEEMTFMGIDSYENLQKAKQEKESLRGGVLTQRVLLNDAESKLGAAAHNYQNLKGQIGTADQSALGMGKSAGALGEDFKAESDLAKILAQLNEASTSEKLAAVDFKAAAAATKEAAAALLEVMRTLGKGAKDENIRVRSDAAAGK